LSAPTRCLERLDARHDGPTQPTHHDAVALAQHAVDQHAVAGGAQPLHGLHLQHLGGGESRDTTHTGQAVHVETGISVVWYNASEAP
jgi:hypothetical protein